MVGWISRAAGLLGVCVLVAACGSGSSSGSSTAINDATDTTDGDTGDSPVATLSGLTPSQFSFTLTEGETDSGQLSFTNNGDAALSYNIVENHEWLAVSPVSGTVAPGNAAAVQVSVTCADADLSGMLNLSHNDPAQADLSISVNASCAAAGNATIQKVTLNQAARGFDSSLADDVTVPVLAGRELLVRAFVTGSNPVPAGQVIIVQPGGTQTAFPLQAPPALDNNPGADSLLSASYYVVVPGSVLTPNSTLRVEIGSGTGNARYPQAGQLDLQIVDPGPFEITFVPVTFQGTTPSIDPDVYLREALQVLPIGEYDVEIRSPYVFNGAYDLDQLLTEMADLRDLDNSNRLYHGIIIPPGGATSGTAGIGYVGYPASVSIDLGGSFYIIAHELGHNLDLGHAPGCGSPNPDNQFPHSDGALGVWGFDIHNDTLVDPDGVRTDFMNYCNDSWVSDYHFNKALEHREQSPIGFGPSVGGAVEGRSVAQAGLTISGRISSDGQISKLRMLPTPAHTTPGRIRPQGVTDLEFVGWDVSGMEVARHEFAAFAIPDLDDRLGFVFNIPAPAAALHHYEIRRLDMAQSVVTTGQVGGVAPAVKTVQVAWQNDSAAVSWQPQDGEVLVVRDAAGQVVTLDSSGTAQLPGADAELEFSLVRDGQAGKTNRLRRTAKRISQAQM